MTFKRTTVTTALPYANGPVHIGHLALANYIAEYEGYDEIWFLITPQNPAKGEGITPFSSNPP